jgi:hypothetical protein
MLKRKPLVGTFGHLSGTTIVAFQIDERLNNNRKRIATCHGSLVWAETDGRVVLLMFDIYNLNDNRLHTRLIPRHGTQIKQVIKTSAVISPNPALVTTGDTAATPPEPSSARPNFSPPEHSPALPAHEPG